MNGRWLDSLKLQHSMTRRQILGASGMGFGALALDWLLSRSSTAAAEKGRAASAVRPPHFPARAKSVIMLLQAGGPSQMDLFDPKPDLQKHGGKVHSEKVEMFQPGSENNKLLASPWKFKKYGQCGMDFSDALPHLASTADDLCMIRSMHSEHNNHTEALVMMTSGKIFPGRPTLGSWISYGLGSENNSLPAFVVLRDPKGYPGTGSTLWQNGWLPAKYRGTEFSSEGAPILNLKSSVKVALAARRDDRDFLAKLNAAHQRHYARESALEARIRNYELAARMQLTAVDVLDLERESAATRRLYGLDNPQTQSFGKRCLMARRLVEAGVRFVQVFPSKGNPWDSHKNVDEEITDIAGKTDLPSAGLIKDLKQRGLLDETIVIWTGEFGRLPVSQNGTGRDHNRNGFTLLMAGGGFKRGHIHGTTNEVGYRAEEDPVSVNDLFATIFHQLGLDHDRLTYEHHGREETLTDSVVTGATVVDKLLDSPRA